MNNNKKHILAILLPDVRKYASLKLKAMFSACLPVCFFEPLQRQDEQLGVMFVRQWRERDW